MPNHLDEHPPGREDDDRRPGPEDDHRRLGRDLDLFDSAPLIGAGLPFWLPAGAAARHAVEQYLYEVERRAGYRHVSSPPLARRAVYEISGHWGHFAPDMFPPMRLSDDPADELVLRPSLCPHHALIYRSRGRSYRDLPLRIAELGGMYRAERSGVLGGLRRVRAMWLNDAHIFCSLDQVGGEIAGVLALADRVHRALGVRSAGFRLSLRGAAGEHAGADADWDRAEAMLRDALGDRAYDEAPGEAAFYGPKIDIQIADPAGRESTLATVQVDFHQPAQFQLSYVDRAAVRQRPVLVHRSLAGTMERLFAHLIEEHRGAFPAWYAPVQVLVAPVRDAELVAAGRFVADCVAAGLRAELAADGSLGARIRAGRLVPYLAVIGAREAAGGLVALRARGGAELGVLPVAEAVRQLARDCAPPL